MSLPVSVCAQECVCVLVGVHTWMYVFERPSLKAFFCEYVCICGVIFLTTSVLVYELFICVHSYPDHSRLL